MEFEHLQLTAPLKNPPNNGEDTLGCFCGAVGLFAVGKEGIWLQLDKASSLPFQPSILFSKAEHFISS